MSHHHTSNTDLAAIGLVAASLYDPKKPDNGLGGLAVGALAAVNPLLGLAAAGLCIAADCGAYRSDTNAEVAPATKPSGFDNFSSAVVLFFVVAGLLSALFGGH
jgi:hypothetical protein